MTGVISLLAWPRHLLLFISLPLKDKESKKDEMVGWYHGFNGHEPWANSGRWQGAGKPGSLQPMGSQRVEHDLATEQQQQPVKEGNRVDCK